jgi:ABC-type dipeptide/oligopeptide/nickel transport system permease component
MKLGSYVVKRLIQFVFVLLGTSIILFTVSNVIPADPVRAAAGPKATPEQLEAIRVRLGFDKPLYEQYIIYISNVLHGDLGRSVMTFRPVAVDLAIRLPATLELSLFSIGLTVFFGVALGIYSARSRNRIGDHLIRLVSLGGISMPSFWLALLFQMVFFLWLGWLPGGGRLSPGVTPPTHITGLYVLDSVLTGNVTTLLDSLHHLVGPAIAQSAVGVASVIRMMRAGMLEEMTKDYVTMFRSAGVSERLIVYKYVLKNSLVPVITLIGVMFGSILGGSFIIEQVFQWPGVGSYGTQALLNLDFQPIMSITLVMSFMYSLSNLVIDIVYVYLNPKVSYE